MIHDFMKAPSLGTTLCLDEQSYELVAAEPYTRRTDGVQTVLLDWEAACPVDGCGTVFRCSTGLRVNYLPRRCEEHRNFTRPVKGKRGRRVKVKLYEA